MVINRVSLHLCMDFKLICHSFLFETFCSGKLKVKITLEGQTIKWSLAVVNIINLNFWFININKKFGYLSKMLFGFCLIKE